MPIQKEIWTKELSEQLYKGNEFILRATNHDEYVMEGKVVHIPQDGAAANVVKNRTVYPATAVQRVDSEVTYLLDQYDISPTFVSNVDTVELSYDKLASIIRNMSKKLREAVADDIIAKWLVGITTANIIRTTGAATAVSTAGQTGTRLAMTANDLKKAKLRMDLANIPSEGRYAMFESNMLDQLTGDLNVTQNRDFSSKFDATSGTIGRLYGFDILQRSTVAMANATATTINANGQTVLATDNVALMCWQQDSVARALGEVSFFDDMANPLYYADIVSALVRMGGRRVRADDLGIIVIAQG